MYFEAPRDFVLRFETEKYPLEFDSKIEDTAIVYRTCENPIFIKQSKTQFISMSL